MMARIYPWHKLPHFWIMASRNANTWVLELKTNVHKTIKMTRVRPLMTNLKVTVRADCAVSAHSTTITSVYKGSCPTGWSGGGSGFGSMSATPTPQLLESEIKQTFLFTNLTWLLDLKQQAAAPHRHTHRFGNSGTVLPPVEGKTTRPFWNDLNEILYDYTVEMMKRFKGLDLIDWVP